MCQLTSVESGTNTEGLTDVFNIPKRAELTPSRAKLGAPLRRRPAPLTAVAGSAEIIPTYARTRARTLELDYRVLGRDENFFWKFEKYLYLCSAGGLGAGTWLT